MAVNWWILLWICSSTKSIHNCTTFIFNSIERSSTLLANFSDKKSNENLNFLYHLHLFKRNDSTSVEKRILCQRIVSMHDNCRRVLQPSQMFSSKKREKKRKNKHEGMCDQFLFHFCQVDNFMEVLTLSLMGESRCWSNPWRRFVK